MSSVLAMLFTLVVLHLMGKAGDWAGRQLNLRRQRQVLADIEAKALKRIRAEERAQEAKYIEAPAGYFMQPPDEKQLRN